MAGHGCAWPGMAGRARNLFFFAPGHAPAWKSTDAQRNGMESDSARIEKFVLKPGRDSKNDMESDSAPIEKWVLNTG